MEPEGLNEIRYTKSTQYGTWHRTGPRQAFPGGSVVNNLPLMQETWVQSLGWEDPLEKEMVTTHSSILAQRIP